MTDWEVIKKAKTVLKDYYNNLTDEEREIENDNGHALNVGQMANHFGIQVYTNDMENAGAENSGAILISPQLKAKYKTDKVITYNANETPLRARYTIAHELGHYFLHFSEEIKQGKVEYFAFRESQQDQYSQQEHEANKFASYLLMPDDKLESVVKRYREIVSEDELIKIVSREFLVSYSAAKFRLKNRGDIN